MEQPTQRRACRKTAAAVLAALALIRGVLLAGLIPPFHGPDELAHFDYAQRLLEHRRMPERRTFCTGYSLESRALFQAVVTPIVFRPERRLPPLHSFLPSGPTTPAARATTGCGPDAIYPPLYFATAAIGYGAVYHSSLLTRIFAARLVSVAWGVLTVVFAYLAGLWWSRRDADALLLALVVLLQPMIGFLSGVVTNDTALFACATGAFAAVAWARSPEHRGRALVLLAVLSIAGCLTKPTFTLILPVVGACAVLALGIARISSWISAAVALAPAACVALAWSRYSSPAMADMIAHAPVPLLPVREFISTWVLDGSRAFRIWVQTYWMTWGWLDTSLSAPYYWAVAACIALAALGIVLGWRELTSADRWTVIVVVGATAYSVAALYGIEYRILSWQGMPFIQGRYLLPLFPLHAWVLILGLRSLSNRLSSRADGAWALVSLLAVLDLASLARVLTRYYS